MDWPKVKLGDCCEVVSGATPKTGNADYWGGDIPWVSPKSLSKLKTKYLSEPTEYITQAGFNSCSTRMLPSMSLLLSCRAPVGLTAINRNPICTNQGFKSLIPDRKILDINYLFHVMRRMRPILESQGRGATFTEVSKAIIERFEIPLPSLGEQKRIAAILDKTEEIKSSSEIIPDLRQRLISSAFLDLFGDTHLNPNLYDVKELKEVVSKSTTVTYGIVQAGSEIENGVPYIRTKDISNGKIQENDLRHTSHEIASKFERSMVREGDLVISIRATVGTIAMVTSSLDGANLTQGTARIAPGDSITSNFLLWHIRSQGSQQWISQQVKGATFKEITLTRLRTLPVMIPPIELQHKFTQYVTFLEQIPNSIELATNNSLSIAQELLT